MNPNTITSWERRRFLSGIGMGAAAFLTRGTYAEALAETPQQAEGPFFPDQLPLDTDNDLLIIHDNLTPAIGQVTHLSGMVKSIHGEPIRNALVEIWQVDGNGVYLHTDDDRKEKSDQNFQGYGRFSTDSKGRYYFRTIKPVSYPGRTPHIHVAVSKKGKRLLTSQCYLSGEASNQKDGLYQSLTPDEKTLVTVDFRELPNSTTHQLTARWNLIIGVTPED